jgi:DNA-binding MarR family transcriptional regulator
MKLDAEGTAVDLRGAELGELEQFPVEAGVRGDLSKRSDDLKGVWRELLKSVLSDYKSTYTMRKATTFTTSRPAGKIASRQKSAKKARRSGEASRPLSAIVLPSQPGHGKRGEGGYLGYLLRQAQAAARLRLERALDPFGVTVPQFVVLTMLKAYPGLSGADLARVALLTPQTVGVIIRNLERDRAIRKTPHPVHGRVLQWTMTSRGLKLLEKCRRQALALERRLSSGLSGTAEATVRRWLAKVAADLQQ